ncbi:DUF3159 domain-containing protein [Oerskovia flava]|uniref:DUF3159 domain-containing protein n=1 Tax=Oerskovia flava TaxID=2986422 RepID=UPI002240D330|nr:DUF3159 domain-containing protein [Oerskovia sp. JB1-3-2]
MTHVPPGPEPRPENSAPGQHTPPAAGPVEPAGDTVDVVGAVGAADDVAAPEDGTARGVRALTAERFSLAETIGGVRGLVESVAPGLVFVVVYTVTRELSPALWSSVAVALVAVGARLVQRTPMTQAFGGLLGVGIGVLWAWRSGEAQDYFAWGLWVNAIYLVAMLVSILVRWPVVGLVVEALRSGWSGGSGEVPEGGVVAALRRWAATWREDPVRMRRYAVATWLWVGMFAVRLAVQLPLYLQAEVGWLGTARLVMGIPLWAFVLWLTWVLVRRPHQATQPQAG